MKPRTAINTLRRILPLSECYEYGNKRKAIDEAVIALRKQVPKKPNYDGYTLSCSTCDFCIAGNKKQAKRMKEKNIYMFCQKCGQAIDWYGMDCEEEQE